MYSMYASMYVQLVLIAKTMLQQCLTEGKSENRTNNNQWYMKAAQHLLTMTCHMKNDA
jgi:hypothetical protein